MSQSLEARSGHKFLSDEKQPLGPFAHRAGLSVKVPIAVFPWYADAHSAVAGSISCPQTAGWDFDFVRRAERPRTTCLRLICGREAS